MPTAVIVGAGISGLALAYRLQQQAPEISIVVLEKDARAGGTMWTERRDGYQVEIGPNGFLDTKPTTVALCRDLGIADRLVPASAAAGRHRFLFQNGRLQPLPASLGDFLKSDLLTWRAKLRLLAERWVPRRRRQGDESVAAFARRRAGAEAAKILADAVVTGIHAGDPALLSLPAAFPRLAAFEQQYGSVLKGFDRAARARGREARARGKSPPAPGRMWSFAEGLRALVETLQSRLRQPPLLGTPARRLERAPGGAWIVRAEGGRSWTADAVVLTCPAYHQAALVADLDRELADRVGEIAYNRVAVVALGYHQDQIQGSVDGFGYIAPQRTRRDVLGVQWCSSIFPQRAPSGMVLLRAMCGGWHRPEIATWDDARLLAAVRGELRLAMAIEAAPDFHAIIRWERAIPQYHLGHLERVRWIAERSARYPGLFLAGNGYHGVAINDCTEQAALLAERIRAYVLCGTP
jgi:oxygen-dependent protoporphyrinogen oxidase